MTCKTCKHWKRNVLKSGHKTTQGICSKLKDGRLKDENQNADGKCRYYREATK